MPDKNEVLRCDFCSRKSDEVAYLIANPGNSAFICDDCAREALSATGRESTTRSTDLLKERVLRGRTLKGVDDFLRCDFCRKGLRSGNARRQSRQSRSAILRMTYAHAMLYRCWRGQDYSRITSIWLNVSFAARTSRTNFGITLWKPGTLPIG